MKWIIASPLLLIALVAHVLTQATSISFIHQCLRTGSFQRRSGLPLVAPLFLLLAFALVRSPSPFHQARTI